MNKYSKRIFNEGVEYGKKLYAKEITFKIAFLFTLVGIAIGMIISQTIIK
jgi:hypothetical protein